MQLFVVFFKIFFNFCSIDYYLSSFVYFVSLFFLLSLARGIPILLLSFQKNSSWFYCTFLFFISIIFISSLIFIISIILWLWILFVLIFLILLGGQLGCLLEIFFLFLEEDILIWTSLLELLLLHPVDFVRLHSCILCLKVLTDFLFDVIIDPLIFF